MSLRCPSLECEGWLVELEDNFCPNCGVPLKGLEVFCEIPAAQGWFRSPVLWPGQVRVNFRHTGVTGRFSLAELSRPDWLEGHWEGQLEPGQTAQVLCQVTRTSPEGLSGQIGDLAIWSSPPPRVRANLLRPLVAPGSREVEVELEILQGVFWRERLPPGWDGPAPLLLAPRSHPRQRVKASWAGESLALEGVEFGLQPVAAGELLVQSEWKWSYSSQQPLGVTLQARGGPVELQHVECHHPLVEVEWSRELVDGSCGQLVLCTEVDLSETFEVDLHSTDGRRWTLLISAQCPEVLDYAGWLLLDYGSSAMAASLLTPEGQLLALDLAVEGGYWPSGVAYLGGGRKEASWGGPHTVEGAKRFLGLDHEKLVVRDGEGQLLQLSPAQVVADSLELLLQRVHLLPVLQGRRLRRLCLTHPAGFSPRQVESLRSALESVWQGEQLILLSEPLAAAFDYLTQEKLPARQWRMLLWDFGGSTSDVAVLRVDSRDHQRVQVAMEQVGGDAWFAGQDITRLLASLLDDPELAEAIKCSAPEPYRSRLDPLVEERLRLGLCPPPLPPDLLVLSGRGSLYPLVGDWLQRQFPGVPLVRSAHPKDCVVRGARWHPEVVRSFGPRSLGKDSVWLDFSEPVGGRIGTARLGFKVLTEDGARFQEMVAPGRLLPDRSELTPVAFLVGENPLEIVENLGWETHYLDRDGQPNRQLVRLRRLQLDLPRAPHPAHTRLVWELGQDYGLRVQVFDGDELLCSLGPIALW